MKSKLKIFLPVFGFMTAVFMLPVHAQNSFLPDNIANIFDLLGEGGSGTAGFITSRVGTALFFALGVLVLFAVVYSLIAAFKYIQSQGDPGQIEEAQKAIKAIFFGIAAMFIGIVGIALVFVFFVSDQPDPSLFQTCLSAPNSGGCGSCKDAGSVDSPANECYQCELWYEAVARNINNTTLSTLETSAPGCIDELDGGDANDCWEDNSCTIGTPPE